MAATRTQIYLSKEQRARLDELRRESGATLAELIRLAVDDYLDQQPGDIQSRLDATFGVAPDFAAPSRAEWAERPGFNA